ncbi:MAG: winged helix-turn-helix domain-containing protein [Acidimicrobiales bacterium]
MGEDASQRRVLGARVSAPKARGLPRLRLDSRLERLWDHRLGLVVAPAGCGKTTLLAQFSARSGIPVAWYQAEAEDVTEQALVAHLARSLGDALSLDLDVSTVRSLVSAIEAVPGARALLAIDDLHLLYGTPSEAAIERLVGYLPAGITVLAGSRCLPAFNLSRLRLSEGVLELGADDLRFRSWEVERLFHDFYDAPLPPDELAELARRTEGWAAGLQLFHLATKGKTPAQRHDLLVALGSRSKLVREYLAHNVLDELGADMREFLLRTSVLGHVSGPLCDALLGRSGSAAVLEELERRQIFTFAVDEEGGYRYHEALRTHLDSMLVQRLGESEVRAEYRRAGMLLEASGLAADALLAYCRGEDDAAAARLLGTDGEQVAADPGGWLEALPPALVAGDPWLQLGRARRYVGAGMLPLALETYQRAERSFGRDRGADVCRRERRMAAAWREHEPANGGDWVELARAATQRDPLAVMRRAGRVPGAVARVVEGAAACLGGRVQEGQALLSAATTLPDAGPTLIAVARVLGELVGLLVGDDPGPVDGERSDGDGGGDVPWLHRVEHALRITTTRRADAEDLVALQAAARRAGDDWGRAVMCLVEGMAANRAGEPSVAALQRAVAAFHALGAPVLEAWATSALAVAHALLGSPEARDVGRAAVTLGTSVSCFGSVALGLRALTVSDPRRSARHEADVAALVQAHKVTVAEIRRGRPAEVPAPPSTTDAEGTPPADARPGATDDRRQGGDRRGTARVASPDGMRSVVVRCFGRFELWIDAAPVPLSGLKPKARSTLRLLATRAGRPVHRDTLVNALWPDGDPRAATRCLQVVVSSLRQVIEPGAARGACSLLVREADAYRLVIPVEGDADVVRFQRGLVEARAARAGGNPAQAVAALYGVLDAYGGDLLPEEGAAEWVVADRDHYRMQAADAANALARLLLDQDDPAGAAAACERGLAIDRYRDELWQSLIEASDRAGRHVAASRARHHYDAVLAELA